jgi:hypothetical protein
MENLAKRVPVVEALAELAIGTTSSSLHGPGTPFNNPFLAQSVWHINAITGNDSADGLTAGTALRTLAQLRARLGDYGILVPSVGTTVSIFLDSAIPASDPFNLLICLGPNVAVKVIGTATTVVRSGSITAVTALNRATNTPWSITDAGIAGTWTTDLLRRLRITGGPRLNAIAWVAKDLGAKTARISPFGTVPQLTTQDSPVPVTPVPGDPYNVELLTTFTMGVLDVRAGATSAVNIPYLAFIDCEVFGSSTSQDAVSVSTAAILCWQMKWNGVTLWLPTSGVSGYWLNNCLNTEGQIVGGGGVALMAGLVTKPLFCTFSAGCLLDGDILFQGAGIVCNGGALFMGQVGVFDTPVTFIPDGDGLTVGSVPALPTGLAGATPAVVQGFLSGNPALYGAGNAGVGVRVASGNSLVYQGPSSGLTLTGVGGDFKLGGLLTAHPFDDPTSAYLASVATTWANLAAAHPGGFAGNAHDPQHNAHLVAMG